MAIQPWQKAFHEGIVPSLSTAGLEALRRALLDDDLRLVQGATTVPPPIPEVADWPCESACPIGYCGWQGDALANVGQVEEYFARVCLECDTRLNEAAAVRYFLYFVDEEPRATVRALLLPEVEKVLKERAEERP
jgi:hypothetical protein